MMMLGVTMAVSKRRNAFTVISHHGACHWRKIENIIFKCTISHTRASLAGQCLKPSLVFSLQMALKNFLCLLFNLLLFNKAHQH
jgi:hypothetical protein